METALQLTIDCADPRVMVAFWTQALGYVPESAPDGHATWRAYWEGMGVPAEELPVGVGEEPESIVDPSGRGPRVWFQQVPEPKAGKNPVHLDLKVGGGRGVPMDLRIRRVDDTVERLTGAGATVLRALDELETYYGVVMQDPEGNEFCVA
ncbi:VOC family protein [Streptomyces sp. NBC_01264]|uniref:VOC family protein n=1 Tax=Streptomyces sp. NBC_01264 TaxID=2903804 RepID=UPI002253F275|nr:VOC family protein [Streptomyces sp. NBC_01264]MCX4778097.1 VOC family protein [Streptomyces sp. NBC_01264]